MFYIMKKDLKELGSYKKIWLVLIVVLIIGLISTTFVEKKQNTKGEVSSSITIGILDLDNSKYSKLLLNYFVENEMYASYIQIVTGTKEELEEKIKNNGIDMYIVVPKDFVQNIVQIIHEPIIVRLNANDVTKAVLMKNVLEGYEKFVAAVEINCVTLYEVMELSKMPQELIDQKNAQISYDLIYTALNKDVIFNDILVTDIKTLPLMKYFQYELLYLVINYIPIALGLSLIKERQLGIHRRLLTTGSNMTWMLVGKTLVYTGIFELFFLIFAFLCNYINKGVFTLQMICCSSLFLFCISTFHVLMSAIIKNTSTYLLATNLLVIFGAIIGGGVIPLAYLPESFDKITKLSPNAWFLKTMIRLNSKDSSLKVMEVFCYVIIFSGMLLISGLLYRKREVENYENL